MSQITRRQHYVWRKYLEPWARKAGKARQIWCLRRGYKTPFILNTEKVAVERDFYRLTELYPEDADFVRSLGFNKGAAGLRDTNEGWIDIFQYVSNFLRWARDHPRATPASIAEADKIAIEFQEDQFSRMENGAIKYLDALVAGDVSFFNDETTAGAFCYFLAHQYFRTKAMQDRMAGGFAGTKFEAVALRTWPILRHIVATNVAFGIFADRQERRLQVINAPPGTAFITSDQPVINLHSALLPPMTVPEETEFFYPVSPQRALIISKHPVYRDVHGTEVSPFWMANFNVAMEAVAHEQLFARSREELEARSDHFK